MSRPLRIKFDGAWYHVMSRGLNYQRIFFNDAHRLSFLLYLEKVINIYGIEIHAYCLIGNHYHLIVHTPRGNISEAMKFLNSAYARYLNIDLQRDGAVFRGRFHAIVISEDSYLLKLSRYIHRNPLSPSVKNLLDYKWSSYPSYIEVTSPPPWLTTHEIINRFGKHEFNIKYKLYVESDHEYSIEHLLHQSSIPPALGNDDFKNRIDEYVKSHSLSSEIVGADRILAQPNLEDLVETVALYFNEDVEMLRTSTTGKKSTPRNIAIYICREIGGHSLPVIGKYMGVSYKAISSVLHRVRNNAEQMKIAAEISQKLYKKSKTITEVNGMQLKVEEM